MPYKDKAKQRKAQAEFSKNKRNKIKFAWFYGKKCVDCGSVENLEIDHRDRSEKVSHRVWLWSVDKREAELRKCDIRCRNCHKNRHRIEERIRPEHSRDGYRRGCRCEECRSDWNAYKKELRRKDTESRIKEIINGAGESRTRTIY